MDREITSRDHPTEKTAFPAENGQASAGSTIKKKKGEAQSLEGCHLDERRNSGGYKCGADAKESNQMYRSERPVGRPYPKKTANQRAPSPPGPTRNHPGALQEAIHAKPKQTAH